MKWLSHLPFGARLARARDGAAAVEFALIVPVMILLFMGTFEITGLLMADLKLTAAAETASDLVAQTTYSSSSSNALQTTDFTNFTNASQQIMTPLPVSANQLKVAYASITFSTGSPVIDWHVEDNGATAITLATIPNNTSNAAITPLLIGSTDSIIVVHAQYSYTSPSTYFLTSTPYTLSEWSFERPRYLACIPTYANSTPGVCP